MAKELTGLHLHQPEVSVVVTAYNDGEFLGSALDSVRQQGFQAWECVVVDDCSVDDTLLVALNRAELDHRIRVLSHEKNLGLSATRNTGIAHARGQFVTFLDADDFLFQDSLERRYATARSAVESDMTAVGSWCAWTSTPESADLAHPSDAVKPEPVISYLTSGGENPVIATSPMLRRDIVLSLNGFREDLRTAEDFEFWMRLLRNGFTLWPSGHNGVAYRQKRQSLIGDGPANHATNAVLIYGSMRERLSQDATSSLAVRPVVEPPVGIPSPIRLASRLLSFLVFAIVAGDERQVEAVASLLTSCPRRVLDQVDVSGAVASALKRETQRRGELSQRYRDNVVSRVRSMLVSVDPRDDLPNVSLPTRTDTLEPGRLSVFSAAGSARVFGGSPAPCRVRRPRVIIELPDASQRFASVDLCLLAAGLRALGIDTAVSPCHYADHRLAAHFEVPVAEMSSAALRVAAASGSGGPMRADVLVHLGDWVADRRWRGAEQVIHLVRSADEAQMLGWPSTVTGWPSRADIITRRERGSAERRCVLIDSMSWTAESVDHALEIAKRLRGASWIVGPGAKIEGHTAGIGARRRLVPELAGVVSLDGAVDAAALLSGVPVVSCGNERAGSPAVPLDDVLDDRGLLQVERLFAETRPPAPLRVGRDATEAQCRTIAQLLG